MKYGARTVSTICVFLFLFIYYSVAGVNIFIIMSDGRSRKSGSKYKRLREEREEKEKEVIKKTAKLETFFTSAKLKTGMYYYYLMSIQGRIKSLLGLFFSYKFKFHTYNTDRTNEKY